MAIPLGSVTPELLRGADIIEAIDGRLSQTLFGGRNTPAMGPHVICRIRVIINSKNLEELTRLKEMIRQAKPGKGP
jgi:hypothetical protein